jgi:hypothetical protein
MVHKPGIYTERPIPPLMEEEAPLLKQLHVKDSTKILVMDLGET